LTTAGERRLKTPYCCHKVSLAHGALTTHDAAVTGKPHPTTPLGSKHAFLRRGPPSPQAATRLHSMRRQQGQRSPTPSASPEQAVDSSIQRLFPRQRDTDSAMRSSHRQGDVRDSVGRRSAVCDCVRSFWRLRLRLSCRANYCDRIKNFKARGRGRHFCPDPLLSDSMNIGVTPQPNAKVFAYPRPFDKGNRAGGMAANGLTMTGVWLLGTLTGAAILPFKR
jgi:hypothetical protein